MLETIAKRRYTPAMPEHLPDPEIEALCKQAEDAGSDVKDIAWALLQAYHTEALTVARSPFRAAEKEAKISEARQYLKERLRDLLGF